MSDAGNDDGDSDGGREVKFDARSDGKMQVSLRVPQYSL